MQHFLLKISLTAVMCILITICPFVLHAITQITFTTAVFDTSTSPKGRDFLLENLIAINHVIQFTKHKSQILNDAKDVISFVPVIQRAQSIKHCWQWQQLPRSNAACTMLAQEIQTHNEIKINETMLIYVVLIFLLDLLCTVLSDTISICFVLLFVQKYHKVQQLVDVRQKEQWLSLFRRGEYFTNNTSIGRNSSKINTELIDSHSVTLSVIVYNSFIIIY